MVIENNKIVEASMTELRALYLNDSGIHELYSFEDYIRFLVKNGVKIFSD